MEAFVSHDDLVTVKYLYDYILKNRERLEESVVSKYEKSIRGELSRLKRKGYVERVGPQQYRLIKKYHSLQSDAAEIPQSAESDAWEKRVKSMMWPES